MRYPIAPRALNLYSILSCVAQMIYALKFLEPVLTQSNLSFYYRKRRQSGATG
jgi:hypothetical protein